MPRKQKTFHFIYKTTCEITNRYYYGMHSTDNLDDGYIGSGTRLWHSINYHGRENHSIEILEYLTDRSSLKAREKELITEEMLNDPMCMNLALGGEGGILNEAHHIKMREGSSKYQKEKWKDPNYAAKYTEIKSNRFKELWEDPEYREAKLKDMDWTGRTHSEETKKKMSEADRTGKKNSQFGTCWITKDKVNKKIKKEELESFINDGWTRGRITKISSINK